MVFADLTYPQRYEEKHEELCSLLKSRFSHVESGLQCDSWILVRFGEDKVAVDTFTSMTHQVKSSRAGKHVQEVIAVLKEQFTVSVRKEPEWEAHEDQSSS
jgi:hypothetical protein